jgi:hypothetical protein
MKFTVTFIHNLHMQGLTKSVIKFSARNQHDAEQKVRWGNIDPHPGRATYIKIEKVKR